MIAARRKPVANQRPMLAERRGGRRGLGCADCGGGCGGGRNGLGAIAHPPGCWPNGDETPGAGGTYPASWVYQKTVFPYGVNAADAGTAGAAVGAAVVLQLFHPELPPESLRQLRKVFLLGPRPYGQQSHPAWPPAEATALGRRIAAGEAFAQKRMAYAQGRPDRPSFAGAPFAPDLSQRQYWDDAVAEQAFLDRVMVYLNGPLWDPCPGVLERYDAAAGYPAAAVFLTPEKWQAVVSSGLRPADLPLWQTPAQAISAEAVHAAYVPGGYDPLAQALLDPATQYVAAQVAAGSPQALTSSAPASAPSAAASPTQTSATTSGATATPSSPSLEWNPFSAVMANALTSQLAPASARGPANDGGGASGPPITPGTASDRSGVVSPALVAVGLAAAILLFSRRTSSSRSRSRRN